MDYHGINMKGPFKGQRVSSLPTWTSDDTGRELYLTTDNKRYYANDVGWIDPNVDKIWTYQDTAPIGWSIVTGTSDSLLACKGGARDYNASGGTQAGTWSMPVHQHLRSHHTHTGPNHTHTGPSHTHTGIAHTHSVPRDGWGKLIGAVDGRIAVGSTTGSVWQATGNNVTGSGGSGTTGADGTGATGSSGTGATGSSGGGLSDYNITISTYRPTANVGIVIEKD